MSKQSNQSRESQSGGGQPVGGVKASFSPRTPGKMTPNDASGQNQSTSRGKGKS